MNLVGREDNDKGYPLRFLPTKQRLLADYEKRVTAFEQAFQKKGWDSLKGTKPVGYSFICKRYQVCLQTSGAR